MVQRYAARPTQCTVPSSNRKIFHAKPQHVAYESLPRHRFIVYSRRVVHRAELRLNFASARTLRPLLSQSRRPFNAFGTQLLLSIDRKVGASFVRKRATF